MSNILLQRNIAASGIQYPDGRAGRGGAPRRGGDLGVVEGAEHLVRADLPGAGGGVRGGGGWGAGGGWGVGRGGEGGIPPSPSATAASADPNPLRRRTR